VRRRNPGSSSHRSPVCENRSCASESNRRSLERANRVGWTH
jgi:hypothetical protein